MFYFATFLLLTRSLVMVDGRRLWETAPQDRVTLKRRDGFWGWTMDEQQHERPFTSFRVTLSRVCDLRLMS